MSDQNIFTEEDKVEGTRSELGPHYFSARRFMEHMLKDENVEPLNELVKSFSEKFYSKTQEAFENWMIENAKDNVQSHIWRTVDEIVRGILSGEGWIFERYALGKYDCEKIRKALLAANPEAVVNQRIDDLEKQVKRLEQDLSFYRSR